MTIVAPVDGDDLDPEWASDVTDAVNGLVVSVNNIAAPTRTRTSVLVAAASVVLPVASTSRSAIVRFRAKVNGASAVNGIMRINSSSSAVYSTHMMSANNGSNNSPDNFSAQTESFIGVVPGNATANSFGAGELVIPAWDVTTGFLAWTVRAFARDGSDNYVRQGGGQYAAAGPYTTITLSPAAGNWAVGSTFDVTAEAA